MTDTSDAAIDAQPVMLDHREELILRLGGDNVALRAQLAEVTTQRDAARAALERDRSIVADTINRVAEEARGREWLLDGRGCYEWDDDKYRAEFSDALAAIRKPIDGLDSIARDWSNCPTDPKEIQQARETPSAAYTRGVHDAADHLEGYASPENSMMADAIRALADTPPAPVVGVKPLVWEIVPTGYGPETYQASAETGFYQVFTDEDSSGGAVFVEFATDERQFGMTYARSIARVNGFHDAKAAAQADYEARILAALLPQSEGGE